MDSLDAAIEQAETMDRIHRKHRKDLIKQVRELLEDNTLYTRMQEQDPNFIRKLLHWPSDLGFARIVKALKRCKPDKGFK